MGLFRFVYSNYFHFYETSQANDDNLAVKSPKYILCGDEEETNRAFAEVVEPSPTNDPDVPWFLDTGKAFPGNSCSWIWLLRDTLQVNLPYVIRLKQYSFDVVPQDFFRPLASADCASFLVFLTMRGIRWEGRGASGRLNGRGPRGEVALSTSDLPSLGTVYNYNLRFDYDYNLSGPAGKSYTDWKDYQDSSLAPEDSRLVLGSGLHNWPLRDLVEPMFNSFLLLYPLNAYLRTWSSEELNDSLRVIFRGWDWCNPSDHSQGWILRSGPRPIIMDSSRSHLLQCNITKEPNEYFSAKFQIDDYNIGIGELVAGWCTIKSMPKRTDGNGFSNSFSAASLGCTFGMSKLASALRQKAANLPGFEKHSEEAQQLAIWVDNYLTSHPDIKSGIVECLSWASHVGNYNILFGLGPNIDSEVGKNCLRYIIKLDEELRSSYQVRSSVLSNLDLLNLRSKDR